MKSLIFIAFFFVASLLRADSEIPRATLIVVVDGIPSIEGQMKIQLLKAGDAEPYRKETAPVRQNSWTWVQKGVPYGRYRIRVFHDKNSNDELDKGIWGIPTEAYGFSNNARSITGPPPEEESLFQVQEPQVRVGISIR